MNHKIQQESLEAFEAVRQNLGKRQIQVLDAIKYLQYATNSMIASYLKLRINQVTGRVKELRDKRPILVKESHTSWCPITKSRATYWELA